jgi:hypothetical protein
MPTNLPKNTKESLKRDRKWNRVILVLIGLALLGGVWVVYNHYSSQDDTKQAP